MQRIRIGLIGDHDPRVTAHQAIPRVLEHAGRAVGVEPSEEWLGTESVPLRPGELLDRFDVLWCVPASPYRNTEGALRAIEYARCRGVPFLGTCGGFQHALLEYAAGVWRVPLPGHAELQPEADDPIIAPLACGLVETDGTVSLTPGTRLAEAYGRPSAEERYHCRYGLSPRWADRLEQGPLRVAARDQSGEVRAVELEGHPFFVATLFQPERAGLHDRSHPIVEALLRAGAERAAA